ncbi:MAG: hypothetical protein ACQEVD_15300 [Actinomycetota bacterium]
MLSTARRFAAQMLPNGVSPSVVEEVYSTLNNPASRSSSEALEQIAHHARTHVPFYQNVKGEGFESLPVVTKPMMVADRSQFFDERVSADNLASRYSSGTSGVLYDSYFDADRISHHRAEMVAAFRFLGADPFAPTLHGTTWFDVSATSKLVYFLQGKRMYSGEHDERSIRGIARWLKRRRGTIVVALCSYLDALFEGFRRYDIEFAEGVIGAVLGIGEPATSSLNELIRTQAGVDLAMRYSNTENGIFGISDGALTRYRLNTATFHFEILDLDSDRPAPPGGIGRIVVTDLFNRASPYIRYDTGDVGRFGVDDAGATIPGILQELGGRNRDFCIGGSAEAPQRILHMEMMERADQVQEIRQFQLRQNDIGTFTWVLNAPRSATLEYRLRSILDDCVGDIVRCDFIYDSQQLVVGSGKRQSFVNEIPNPERLFRPRSLN